MSAAVIYSRISHDATGEGLGVARQEEECRQLAERLGLEVTEVYSDNDISATTGKRRPEFERMLADRPEVILTYAQDRLARHPRDMERLLDLGCTVHAIISSGVDLATPPGRATARTLVAWALAEVETKGLRQRSAARQRAAQGRSWWSRRPIGYNLDGSLHEFEGPLIAEAFSMFVRGASSGEVARFWAEKGLTRQNSGEALTARDVRRILSRPLYAGIRTYQGQEVGRGAWEPTVSEEVYRAAQAIFAEPRRKTTASSTGNQPVSELSSLPVVTCARCGSYLKKGSVKKRKEFDGTFYVCAANNHASWPQPWLEGVVFKRLVRAVGQRPELWFGGLGEEDSRRVEALKAEEIALDGRSAELGKAFASGVVTLEVLTSAVEAIKDRKGEIASELALLGASAPFTAEEAVTDWDFLAESIAALPMGEYRALLTKAFSSIECHPRGRGSHTLDRTLIRFTSTAS